MFAFIFALVPAFQQLRFNAAKCQKRCQWTTTAIIYHRQDANHLCCLALVCQQWWKLKTKQSLNNQTVRSSTVAVPWIWPGCQMKTDAPNQSGINGELVIQSSHVGPESQPPLKTAARLSISTGVHKWGGKSDQRKQHPAVSQSHTSSPALMGWSQTPARHCEDPAGQQPAWPSELLPQRGWSSHW